MSAGRVQRPALGRGVGGAVADDRKEDTPAVVRAAREPDLPDARLQHRVGSEAGILAERRVRSVAGSPSRTSTGQVGVLSTRTSNVEPLSRSKRA
jgi:hypothetical protein